MTGTLGAIKQQAVKSIRDIPFTTADDKLVAKSQELVLNAFKPVEKNIELNRKKLELENPNFLDSLEQGVGSAASFFIPGMGIAKLNMALKVAPKIALLFGNALSTAFEAATESGSVYNESITMGRSLKEADKAATKTFVANAILIGLTNKFGAFSDKIQSGILRSVISSPMEGLQELLQTWTSNIATGKPFNEGGAVSFLIGTILGIPMGALGGPSGGIEIEKKFGDKGMTLAPAPTENIPFVPPSEQAPTVPPVIEKPKEEAQPVLEAKAPVIGKESVKEVAVEAEMPEVSPEIEEKAQEAGK